VTVVIEDELVPIRLSADVVETVAEWLESDDGSVGVCLVSGERIMSEADMVEGTNRHRCAI
jgi:hypothetical protein